MFTTEQLAFLKIIVNSWDGWLARPHDRNATDQEYEMLEDLKTILKEM